MNAAVVHEALQVQAAGELAHTALGRCDGRLRLLPAFPDSPYLLADEEIVWLGRQSGTWHPRRILLAKPRPPGVFGALQVSTKGAGVWHAPPLPRLAPERLVAGCMTIAARVADIGTPGGFGLLLAGEKLRFPLDLALARLRALTDAVNSDDAAEFEAAALPLLGLGIGLTPSGDDLVGACLFAHRLRGDCAAWNEAGLRLTQAAAVRSNRISAVLFADLARGNAYAPLHELANAMAGKASDLLEAARALTAIGHSSGWDLLTGFILGASGTIGWSLAANKDCQPIQQYPAAQRLPVRT